jgi:hypothetical protein
MCSATDQRGNTATGSFTVQIAPFLSIVENQQNAIGAPIAPLQLPVTACRTCTFTVSNLPPDLTFDARAGLIAGNIAFTAFTREDGSEPQYQVSMAAMDATTGLASTRAFTWRITQGEVVSDSGGDGGEDGGGGDSGDGGAEGDAGDGGDASPLANAHCVFYALDGSELLDNKGNLIETTTDANGHFILPIPPDLQRPGFLIDREGFIECTSKEKTNLIVSTYLNTKGLRSGPGLRRGDGERLKVRAVNPATTVSRLILENLRTADGKKWSPGADPVAIHRRLQNETDGQLASSPSAKDGEAGDPSCGSDGVQEVINVNIPLLGSPPDDSQKRARMAGYIASQLFLAALKGENVLEEVSVLDTDAGCTTDIVTQPSIDHFHTVLNTYFKRRQVMPVDLVLLGLQQDLVIKRGLRNVPCH